MTTKAQLAQYCADHFTHKIGFSMTSLLISNAVAAVVGAIAGWYVKGRGWFGVKTDAQNAVNKVESVVKQVETNS